MPKPKSIRLFAVITLVPVPLLSMGMVLGGVWIWLALGYLTLLTYALDKLCALVAPNAENDTEFPAADGLAIALGLAHFAVLALGIRAVCGNAGLAPLEQIASFFAAGLFMGQVSNSNAHELIHRQNRLLRRLGMWVYISLMFGHHSSAHPLVHHTHVATAKDPNSARIGESYYRFAPRAWIGSFRLGLLAERARRTEAPIWQTPYGIYILGGLGCLAMSTLVFGPTGLIAHIGLAGYATAQLLLSDYVQHYGLERNQRAAERYEPVGPQHSWNAKQWFSGYLMLNAARHSHHHTKPGIKYPELHLPTPDTAPMLPFSLPVMGAIALLPPLWHHLMDKRALKWRAKSEDPI